ncbi:hypothetical protein [Amantichitinum ursilacus]|uniref:Uncharacterized protein n=1 Tax=Amantichitinum ursilacus TaxID=857265 RepID=A0A0N0GR05_9NEIS|nr:hypothetical protein [Amantichitinum ursilacus]KPC55208.1 hypothetical protein WG78_01080 [Amantichitinum ursilacus]
MYDLTLAPTGPIRLEPGQRYWCAAPTRAEAETLLDLAAGLVQLNYPGRVAVLESNGGLLSNLRVWENLILPAWYQKIAPLPELEARFVTALQRLGIGDTEVERIATALPVTLERDRKRMLLLVRAAILRPGLMLLDQDMWGHCARSALLRPVLDELSANAAVLVIGQGAPEQAWGLHDLTLTPETT